MSENYDALARGIDHLLQSKAAAMLDDRMYADLENFCMNARNAADSGDLQEAHRLFSMAKQFVAEEDSIPGTE